MQKLSNHEIEVRETKKLCTIQNESMINSLKIFSFDRPPDVEGQGKDSQYEEEVEEAEDGRDGVDLPCQVGRLL